MLQKKVCLLGAFAVGKTSLVAQFVTSMFDEKYLTTMGVKVDKKIIELDGQEVNLLLWDIAGEDEFQKVQTSYLRGSAGYILVADGTRGVTVDQAMDIRERVNNDIGELPCVLVVNKHDLVDDWEVGDDRISQLEADGWTVLKGSAKTGEGVEEAFLALTGKILNG